MLTAVNKDGELISLVNLKDKRLLNQEFFCPACRERVIAKTGSGRKWHFAHYHNSNCTASEPESEYHLNGKLLLYQWLKTQKQPVELEKYFASIKQRADLYAGMPIEFQCSTIRDELFLLRTKNYMKVGKKPLWILGGNRFKQMGTNLFRLSRMDWLALNERTDDAHESFLLYYCPTADKFVYLTNIVPYSSTKVIASLQYFSRKKLNYENLYKPSILQQNSINQELWQKVKTNWRVYPNRRKHPALNYVNRMLLQVNRSLPLFPSEAGIPTKYSFWIETPPYLWQTWLLLRFIFPHTKQSEFQFQQVYSQFKSLVQRRIFSVRNLPLIENSHYSFAIMDYLFYLSQLGILKKIGKSTFIVKQKINLPHTLEEAINMDTQINQNR